VYGEPYVNFAENQFGIFNPSNVAVDLLGVPMFSTLKSYVVGNPVNNGGLFYVANQAVSAGAFNSAQWTQITGAASPGAIVYNASQSLTTAQQGVALRNIGAAQLNLINGKIVESHATNAATFAIKTLAGSDPSASDPVGVIFTDASTLWLTAALSLVIPSGARVGSTANATPFRLWFAIANNAGTPLLVVRNCTVQAGITSTIRSFDARGILTTTTISASANSAQVNYASAAASNILYRIVGFADYEAGQPTMGSWTVSPTRIVLQTLEGILPGAVLGTAAMSSGTQSGTAGSAWVNSSVTLSASLSSPINPWLINAYADCYAITASATALYGSNAIARGATLLDAMSTSYSVSSYPSMSVFNMTVLDLPFTVAAQTYAMQINAAGIATYYSPYSAGGLSLDELMG
jgi:hypothetical protein